MPKVTLLASSHFYEQVAFGDQKPRAMILKFTDEYRWLSNFADVRVKMDGVIYKSVEHAYQAAKSEDKEWRSFCKTEEKASKVKRYSRRIEIREDWNELRVDIMRNLLVQKFGQEPYRSLLIETGQLYIIEGNDWGDRFWGVDLNTGEGKNALGRLIMDIRDEICEWVN